MLPPIDESVLENNPDFSKLYKYLTGALLHPDGSTRNDSGAKKRDAVRAELKSHRTRAAKKHLLHHALSTAKTASSASQRGAAAGGGGALRRPKSHVSSSRAAAQHQQETSTAASSSQLPPELLDLLILLPPFLDKAPTTPPSSLELLLSSPPFSDLPSLLPQLTPLISSHLVTQASGLAQTLHPQTNPSFIHRSIPQILPTTQTLQSALTTRRALLSSTRLSTTSTLIAHFHGHTDALTHLVRALESKHGAMANSSELRASEASLLTQHLALSLRLLLWETRAAVYPSEAQTALRNYRRHLREAEMTVENNIRTREAELADYGVGVHSRGGNEAKERTMREMARVWRDMETRLAEVQRDLDRLGTS